MADDDLDPALRRLLGEATAHGDEARRLVADYAKARAPVAPASLALVGDMAEDLASGLIELAELQRAQQSTVPDSGALSVSGPYGWRVSRAPAWLVLALGIVAIVAGCLTYVATH